MEEVKRLSPTTTTLRRLYTVSGNQCAFPGCVHPMFNNEGNFVGQVCHIEAALPGGERFNPHMTNEDRRAYENLMLMCYDHHIETNKEHIYSTRHLQQIKHQHEMIYSNVDQFITQMQSTIRDVTESYQPVGVKSLTNLYVTVYGEDSREPEHIAEDISAFNSVLNTFSTLSPDARRFFAIALSRAKYELNYNGTEKDNLLFDPYELERVTGLQSFQLRTIIDELERASFVCIDEEEYSGRNFPFFRFPNSEVDFWELIKKFCIMRNLNVTDIVDNMKFSILD